ncbi:MAG: hypothetical protein ACFCVK_01500 [Acidimicrobiales bacterium]
MGLALAAAAVAVTAVLNALYQRDPDLLLRPAPVMAEIAIGTTMLIADTWVFGSGDHPQTLPSVWVVAAVATVALAGGRRSSPGPAWGWPATSGCSRSPGRPRRRSGACRPRCSWP